MNEFMKCILSRVLSEEVGRQEHWADLEEEKFGFDRSDREDTVEKIKTFMVENGIDFREDFYSQTR